MRARGNKELGKDEWRGVAIVFIVFEYPMCRIGSNDLEGNEIGTGSKRMEREKTSQLVNESAGGSVCVNKRPRKRARVG